MFNKLLKLIGLKYEVKFSQTDYIILIILLTSFVLYAIKEVYTINKLNANKIETVDVQTYCIEQICVLKDNELECFKIPKPEYFSLKTYRNMYTNTETYGFIFESKNKQCE